MPTVSSKYDEVDGGIAATFIDGPKRDHVGVVTPIGGGAPPEELTFLDDMVYVRAKRMKVKANNAWGQAVEYRGVGYKIDTRCGFYIKMMQEIEQAKADALAGRVETQ